MLVQRRKIVRLEPIIEMFGTLYKDYTGPIDGYDYIGFVGPKEVNIDKSYTWSNPDIIRPLLNDNGFMEYETVVILRRKL